MTDVRLFHFLNGEDVLAELVSEVTQGLEDFGLMKLRNPCIVVMQRDPTNSERVSIQLHPWCPFTAEKELMVSRSHVVFVTQPVQELVNQFSKIFGSGIVVASATDIPQAPGATLHRIK